MRRYDVFASIGLTFGDVEDVQQQSRTAFSLVSERLPRHLSQVISVNKLWYCIEASWSSVSIYGIHSLVSLHVKNISGYG